MIINITHSRTLQSYLSNNNRKIYLRWDILKGLIALTRSTKFVSYGPIRTFIQKKNVLYFFVPELTIQWSLTQVLSSAT